MIRKPRRRRTFNVPGEAHELTFSCYHKFSFLKAEQTAEWLADAINQARVKLDFAIWAYVFMPDHVHLIVWPRKPVYKIENILSAIKEPTGRRAVAFLAENAPHWLARISRRRGKKVERHFWQPGGGFDRNIRSRRRSGR
jgi:putative transposase